MDAKYLINIDDGRLEFRDEYADMQVNLKPVPDEIVEMLMKGEVTKEEVLLAVGRKERENGFDLHKYIEDRKKLNVRTSDPKEDAPKPELRDRTSETISVEEVVGAKANGGKNAEKPEKVEKPGKKPEKAEKAEKAEKKVDEKPSDDGLSGIFG